MGMFDYINIDNKWIPKEKQVTYDKQCYQTKSLECYLENYDILEDGKILKVDRDEGEPMGSEIFSPCKYTGEIRFYDDRNEFKAWCVDGIVKEVIDVT